MNAKNIKLLIGFGVSALLVGWMVYAMDWSAVGDEIWNAQYLYCVPALLLLILHYILRSYRWRLLCLGADKLSLRLVFDSYFIGNLATFVLPLRVGEFIRPGFITLKSDISFSSGLVSVVIERFFDLSAVLLSFGAIVLVIPGVPEVAVRGAQALLVLAICILVFIALGAICPAWISKVNAAVLSKFPQKISAKAGPFLSNLVAGAGVLRSGKVVTQVVLLTVAVWLSTYAFFYVFFFAFNIPATLVASVAVGTITALAVAAPSAPGFVGVYQAGCVAALALFAVTAEKAGAYGILNHLLQYVLVVGYGSWTLSQSALSLGDLRRQFSK